MKAKPIIIVGKSRRYGMSTACNTIMIRAAERMKIETIAETLHQKGKEMMKE